MKRLAIILSFLLSALCGFTQAAEPSKPNLLLILADDLGYGDVQCYNPERAKIPTPHIDRLAKQGMKFTDAHTSSGVCSPTRYALLTGRYHWRSRLQTGIVGYLEEPLIAPDRLTLAGLLKQHGYRTACIGKWHLGWDWSLSAEERTMLKAYGGKAGGGGDDVLATPPPGDAEKWPDTLRILSAAIRGVPQRASTISLDSSEMSEEENIAHICQLCAVAGEAGLPLTLEMEAGVDAGVTEIEVADRLLGAVESRHPGFLALWAPGVGTQHGLSDKGYPFSAEAVARHQERASQICGRPIGLALHGSSGLKESDLREGVAAGVAKVNWSSESLLIRSQAAREFFTTHSAELEKSHKQWKATAMDNGVQSYIAERYVPRVIERIRILGGAGKGGAPRS
jgi:fructose/tagatose bisphosphate aldolase